MNGGQFMTWEEFKFKFSKYHVPPGLIKKMRDEFRELKQGRLTVVEYRDRFLTLSRYAPDETDTTEKRQERFLNGLHDEMQTVLVNIPFTDLEALVDSAIQMEGKMNQANENRKRRGYNNNYNNNNYNRAPPRAPNNNSNNTNTAPRTGSNAIPVATKDKATITCYECGVVGNYSNECPKRLAGNTAVPAQQQRRVSTGKKFAPNNPNNRNGRLYHMNGSPRSTDVVLHKSYADKRRREMTFENGDFVYLKLPEEMSAVHDVFYILTPPKCLGSPEKIKCSRTSITDYGYQQGPDIQGRFLPHSGVKLINHPHQASSFEDTSGATIRKMKPLGSAKTSWKKEYSDLFST
ncbi:hypothetical protein QYE76_066165 [Lolium multiflorum]|uniref:CCHC-type domain-containing protein n=1 Tax=Lolium multiflorum TaxID=4521 RepID=A0AAD8SCC7_LOLMU|nr:hypothetical protein QYE76_066165 [Lolium multiflorum]